MYLQSVKSPLLARGRFKMNTLRERRHDDVDVFSQTIRESDNDEYEEDSFIVTSSQVNQSGNSIIYLAIVYLCNFCCIFSVCERSDTTVRFGATLSKRTHSSHEKLEQNTGSVAT